MTREQEKQIKYKTVEEVEKIYKKYIRDLQDENLQLRKRLIERGDMYYENTKSN